LCERHFDQRAIVVDDVEVDRFAQRARTGEAADVHLARKGISIIDPTPFDPALTAYPGPSRRVCSSIHDDLKGVGQVATPTIHDAREDIKCIIFIGSATIPYIPVDPE
jgi:hypothetical protein